AHVASDMPGGAPRHTNKIEVNLRSRETSSGKLGVASATGKQGIAPASQESANSQAARQSESQTEFQSGAALSEASLSEARRSKKPKSRALNLQGDETPLEGEMSKFMKMSLLFITLIIGVISGALLYGYTPVKDILDSLMSNIAPNERGQQDPEIISAFALHQEGRSDEARTRINTALTANPANAEAL